MELFRSLLTWLGVVTALGMVYLQWRLSHIDENESSSMEEKTRRKEAKRRLLFSTFIIGAFTASAPPINEAINNDIGDRKQKEEDEKFQATLVDLLSVTNPDAAPRLRMTKKKDQPAASSEGEDFQRKREAQRKRVEELAAIINRLYPRDIARAEAEQTLAFLRTRPTGKVTIGFDARNQYGERVQSKLLQVFSAAGWDTEPESEPLNVEFSGLAVVVPRGSDDPICDASPAAKSALAALRGAGMATQVAVDDGVPPDSVLVIIGKALPSQERMDKLVALAQSAAP